MGLGDKKAQVKGKQEPKFPIGDHHTRGTIKSPEVKVEAKEKKEVKKSDLEEVVKKSITIRKSYVDLLNDAVYSRKFLNGQPWVSQQDVLEEALELYKAKNEVKERPAEFKEYQEGRKEKIKAGQERKKRS